MKNMKRIAALGLSIIMVAGVLTGCGSDGKEPANNEESKTQTESSADNSTADNEEPVKIEWLAYNCYEQPDENAEIIKMVEEEFNVDFEFWFVDDQKWDEILGAKLSSGDMPDIMRIKNTSNIPTYVKQGILAEWPDWMLEKTPSFVAQVEEADTEGNADIDVMYEGKRYAIKIPSLNGTYPTVLVWRNDWLKNVGINKIPETLDEFEEAIYAFRNNDPDGNGKKDTYGISNTTMNAVFGAYGPIPLKEFRGTGTQNLFYIMKDGKIDYACIQPEMKDALAKLQKWYADGVIDPEFITGENTAGYWATSQAFENGKVGVTGMVLSDHWQTPINEEGLGAGACYNEFFEMHPELVFGEDIEIGGSLVGPNGASGTHCWGAFNSTGFGITTKCAEDPRKMEVIAAMIEKFSSDPEWARLLQRGIEGKHYEKVEGGFKALPPYDEPGTNIGTSVLGLGINFQQQREDGDWQFEFRDKYKTTGYSDILVPPTEAADAYLTDLKTDTLDAYIKIITGEESIDYFDTFVDEFLKNGGAEILEEINATLGF